jgi:cerevisin
VLDNSGSGYTSDILAGIDYVVRAHATSGRNSIISMSVGGVGDSESMDDTIENAWNSGVFTVGKREII